MVALDPAAEVPVSYGFASDNCSPMCPEALEALIEANQTQMPGYGSDPVTQATIEALRTFFSAPKADVFFVPTGTAGNALALAQLARPFESVVCHAYAHILTDECGAPGFLGGGLSLRALSGEAGRLSPETLRKVAMEADDPRYPRAKVLSLTQSTEVGTVYDGDPLKALCEEAHRHGWRVHMDGARFIQAVAALKASPEDLSWRAGVDVLTLGASKSGGGIGDAIVFFDRGLAEGFRHRIKQAGHLVSKMRYMAAPFLGLIRSARWLHHAEHANQMAAILAEGLLRQGIVPVFERQTNAVFVDLDGPLVEALFRSGWRFFRGSGHQRVRLMCSWNTDAAEVHAFLNALAEKRIEGDGRGRAGASE